MRKIGKIILIILIIIIIIGGSAVAYVKTALPNVGKAPEIKVSMNPDRVTRGAYLANHVAICMDCHSQRDWSMYAGPIKQGTFGGGGEKFSKESGFPGTLYSKNITDYGLHNWTDGEIFRAITSGENKNGEALFPLMGYLNYGKLDKEDITSIIAYLRTLPSLKNDVPARNLDFPVSILVNTMPTKAEFTNRPDENNKVAYGSYLITAAQCIECHSKVDKGKKIAGTEYGGGREFLFPNGTWVHSANITPDNATGIGNWSEEMFIKRFKQYDNPGSMNKVSEKDYNTIMPWYPYSGMTEKDLAAIYAYLRTVKPIHNSVQKFGNN